MKKQVIFIHSAGEQGALQGSSRFVAYLHDELDEGVHLLLPKMPFPKNPKYELWREKLDQELSALEGEVILIGHSLGGSVLIKYLSEVACDLSIIGLFMIAAPYWNKEDSDWHSSEYMLPENFASKLPQISKIFLYHSTDDEIVPYTHLNHFKEKLPEATARVLSGNEHFFNDGLPELVDDLKSL
ncbi:alpha/beta fold hydrolase [Bacillus gobiensis]|uniref:alpha/beta fold hydrolase n=1 Tax=Bacillus gobiensis TaxID=1441095 RepID=UPI003D220FFD